MMFKTNELRNIHMYPEKTSADEIDKLQNLIQIKDRANNAYEKELNRKNDELELLRWRVETALKVSYLEHIDSPQERMEMILRGDYDNNREEALRDDQYPD